MIDKIIIFGKNGMLGNYLNKYFENKGKWEVIGLERTDFEITVKSIAKLDVFLRNYNINEHTCIINCNGLIPQRIEDREDTEYYIVNTLFSLQLDNVCKKYNTKLIYPTTDCVFSGKKGHYVETDEHDEEGIYGISKSLGEKIKGSIIRTSIIGEERLNKKSFLEFVKNSNGIINGWSNHYWNGITCYQYCKVIEIIIDNNLFWEGVRHIYSPESKTKYELACIIKNVYKVNCIIQKKETDVTINKTLLSIYDIHDIFQIPTIEKQIEEQFLYGM